MKFIRFTALIIGLFFISSCTTVDSDSEGFTPEQIAEVVDPGDSVKILTKSDGKYQFVVAGVTEAEITGGGVTIQNSDVKALTVTAPDGVKKTFKALSVTNSILNIFHIIDAIK